MSDPSPGQSSDNQYSRSVDIYSHIELSPNIWIHLVAEFGGAAVAAGVSHAVNPGDI